jgi:phosphate transport system permease protein
LRWIPGFPVAERLNALTAGSLLALVAVPTIFTLAEDALDNVPLACKEASEALGASRLQTVARVLLPAALPGILTAILLGFGRVIGETMIVLLCAGNRIAIPDFSTGPAVVTQPVHTMTGIIAQEMGEVVHGSIHYRALFALGIVLLTLSLLINYIVQKTASKHVQPRA